MLKYLIFIIPFFTVNSLFSEFLDHTQNVKGPVKGCLVTEYSIVKQDGVFLTNIIRISERNYTDSGLILTNLLFDPDDLVQCRYRVVHRYNKNNQVEMVETVFNTDGSLLELYLYQYSYNQNNQLIESKKFIPQTSSENKVSYLYNGLNKLSKQSTYGDSGTILYYQTFSYDKYEKIREISMFNPRGNLIYKLVYKHYNKDKRMGVSYFSTYGNLDYLYQQKFNEWGDLLEEFEYKILNDSGKQKETLINFTKFTYKSK